MPATRTPINVIRAQIADARRAEEHNRTRGRRALGARYNRRSGRVMIELTNGCVFGFPAARHPALAALSHAELAGVSITPAGSGLAWDALDIHVSVAGLLLDAIDRASTRSELARIAGRARGGAKAAAARANGKKGGRPRKQSARAFPARNPRKSDVTVALRPLGSREASAAPAPATVAERLALLKELSQRAFRAAGKPTHVDNRSAVVLRPLRAAVGAPR